MIYLSLKAQEKEKEEFENVSNIDKEASEFVEDELNFSDHEKKE